MWFFPLSLFHVGFYWNTWYSQIEKSYYLWGVVLTWIFFVNKFVGLCLCYSNMADQCSAFSVLCNPLSQSIIFCDCLGCLYLHKFWTGNEMMMSQVQYSEIFWISQSFFLCCYVCLKLIMLVLWPWILILDAVTKVLSTEQK